MCIFYIKFIKKETITILLILIIMYILIIARFNTLSCFYYYVKFLII